MWWIYWSTPFWFQVRSLNSATGQEKKIDGWAHVALFSSCNKKKHPDESANLRWASAPAVRTHRSAFISIYIYIQGTQPVPDVCTSTTMIYIHIDGAHLRVPFLLKILILICSNNYIKKQLKYFKTSILGMLLLKHDKFHNYFKSVKKTLCCKWKDNQRQNIVCPIHLSN